MSTSPNSPDTGVMTAASSRELGEPPWKVCISYTSELGRYPAERPYLKAAEAAVTRAGHASRHMEHIGAGTVTPAESSRALVLWADVFVGLVGLRLGGVMPGQRQSYAQYEFDTATEAGLPRLVFLIDRSGLPATRQRGDDRLRQVAYRERLDVAGLTFARVATPDQLQFEVYDALVRLAARHGS
jgi:Domain of unknown function (DUF4062)